MWEVYLEPKQGQINHQSWSLLDLYLHESEIIMMKSQKNDSNHAFCSFLSKIIVKNGLTIIVPPYYVLYCGS